MKKEDLEAYRASFQKILDDAEAFLTTQDPITLAECKEVIRVMSATGKLVLELFEKGLGLPSSGATTLSAFFAQLGAARHGLLLCDAALKEGGESCDFANN